MSDITPPFSDAMRHVYALWFVCMFVLACVGLVVARVLDVREGTK